MGATYTRQSSAGIVDGSTIEASDINDEFDELLAAFVAASGHTHDGTAAEGGPVTKLLGTSLTLGDGTAGTDITVTFDGESSDGVLTWMEDEDLFKFSDAVTVGVDDTGYDVKFFGDTASRYWLWDTSADGVVQRGTLTVGVDDTGHDVKFFGDTASAYMLWDTSADDLVLAGAAGIDLAGDIDVDGTSNLDAVDIDGAVQIDGAVTVGVDDTGLDVKFFGASAGAYGLYDQSENAFEVRGATAAGAGLLKLTTGELTVVDADKLGRIDFQAPLESDGTDAILVGASIWAEADDTFAAGVNNTDLVFALGKSEAAAEKFRFTADTEIGIAGANYGTDGQVLTSGGAGAAVAWEDASGGAALTGSTNNTVVTVTGSSAIQGEANFTYDSTDAALTSSTSTKPIFSLTNTNTDANGAILKFIKDAGEAGAASDVPGLISFYCDDAGQAQTEFARIQANVIDATAGGEEGSLDFHVAEYDGTLTKGMSITGLASDGNITVDVSTHDGSAGGLKLGGTLVTTTATELNLVDGGTSRGTTAVASGDGILINDNGTMAMTNVDTVSTYFASHSVGGGNIVTTGALDSGSITSGFGAIDNGTSGIRTNTFTAETSIIPDASGGADLGSTSAEWGDVYIADDKYIQFGSDQNILVGYDETTTDSLKIAATEGAGLAITLMADEGDDAGDEWKLNVADGGTITLGNDIASAGTFVTHLTIAPNSTITSSLATFAGEVQMVTLDIGGTNVTSTAAELNLMDGGTSATSTTIADADRLVLNDNGTMVQVAVTDMKTYIGGGTSWQAVKTGAFTAVAGEGYFVNTTSSAFTATLPAGTIGDEISFIDYAGTFDSYNLTVDQNGSEKIHGSTDALIVSVERAAFTLVFTDSTQGWLLTNN